jgi:DNA invertase Pin-like site-specific DNA recombinase
VFREVASGAKTNRIQLRRAIASLGAGDLLMVTRLDRLARSTRDLLNTLAAIADQKAGFRSLSDALADTTTSHGRLMLAAWRSSNGIPSTPAPARAASVPGLGA